ncbi:hypothetical protein PENTCL1PPCAC_5650, partial [Pristionchus entomophagus]
MSHDGLDREAEEEKPDQKFHIKHSECIKRSEDGSSVVRWDSANELVVFSNRPISIDERVSIRLSQIDVSRRKGSLLVGFMTHDPESVRAWQLLVKRQPFASRSSIEKQGYVSNSVHK